MVSSPTVPIGEPTIPRLVQGEQNQSSPPESSLLPGLAPGTPEATIVSTPHEDRDHVDETIYTYDPGLDSINPKEYSDLYISMRAGSINTRMFSENLLSLQPGTPWPEDWSSREDWIPLQPLLCSTSCQHPLDSEAAEANFKDWLTATENSQPLLHILPTQDHLDLPSKSTPVRHQPPLSTRPPKLDTLLTRTSQYWGDLPQERQAELEDILEEAFALASREYGVSDAVAAGNAYVVPTNLLTRDLQRLVDCGGNLRSMASDIRQERSDQRLSLDRIQASLDRKGVDGTTPRSILSTSTTVDALRLARLAEDGIPIPRYPSFAPNQQPPPPKHVYKQVYEAVNCTLTQLWEQCLVFIVPTVALLALGGCHWTQVGWTTKVGKALGRYLFDARSRSAGTPLNSYSTEYLDALRHEWGHLTLPTIVTLVRMILSYENAQRIRLGVLFNLSMIVLLKGDLSKAFTLLSFSADSVELTASELYQPNWDPLTQEQSDLYHSLLQTLHIDEPYSSSTQPSGTGSWSMLYHTGSFGLRILPFVFGVVSRFLLFLLSVAIRGSIDAYVDDFMACTLLEYLAHDVACICEVVSLLLGPHAIEWGKWFAGRQVEWIGWSIDLDTRRVSFARRNYLKVLHGFFSFDVDRHVQVRHLVKLASWASRYTTVLRTLTPFTSSLYSQVSGMKNLDAFIPLSPPTIIAIWMWRATLLQLGASQADFSRPLDSFSDENANYCLEYDSCLSGTGLIISYLPPLIDRRLCGQTEFPFQCGQDSSFQNVAELTPVAIGLASLAQLGVRHARIRLIGDSTTSLAWSKSGKFTGSLCTRTAIILMLVAVIYDLTIVDAIHIPGDDNGLCDHLSRGYTNPSTLGFSPPDTLDFTQDSKLSILLELCDPTLESPFVSESEFIRFWTQARTVVLSLAE